MTAAKDQGKTMQTAMIFDLKYKTSVHAEVLAVKV